MHTFKILNGIDVVDSEIWLRQMGNEVLQETHPTTETLFLRDLEQSKENIFFLTD